MLRIPAVLGLLVGASCAAGAQELTLTLTQGAAHNYALIAPDAVSTDVTVKQTGQTNAMASFQSGPINEIDVDQRAKSANTAYVDQLGGANVALVTPQYNFGGVPGMTPGYSSQQTSIGFLSEFNSGGVSILALTGPGNTLIGNFGRTH
jgi:hypothetical protein